MAAVTATSRSGPEHMAEGRDGLMNVLLWLLSSGSRQKPVLFRGESQKTELLILSRHRWLCPFKSNRLTPYTTATRQILSGPSRQT